MAAPDLGALLHVAQNLREMDKREVFCGHAQTPDKLATDAFTTRGYCDVAWVDHRPVAVIGAQPLWPGLWQVWAWGTEEWPRVALTLTKHAVRVLKPLMLQHGGHRAQCHSHVLHTDAHRWLKFFGFTCEGLMQGYGREQEDFLLFAWRIRDHVLQQRRRERQLATVLHAATGRESESG